MSSVRTVRVALIFSSNSWYKSKFHPTISAKAIKNFSQMVGFLTKSNHFLLLFRLVSRQSHTRGQFNLNLAFLLRFPLTTELPYSVETGKVNSWARLTDKNDWDLRSSVLIMPAEGREDLCEEQPIEESLNY